MSQIFGSLPLFRKSLAVDTPCDDICRLDAWGTLHIYGRNLVDSLPDTPLAGPFGMTLLRIPFVLKGSLEILCSVKELFHIVIVRVYRVRIKAKIPTQDYF